MLHVQKPAIDCAKAFTEIQKIPSSHSLSGRQDEKEQKK
jgi:hypothetical protein